MRALVSAIAALTAVGLCAASAKAEDACEDPKQALGVSRVIEIDGAAGPIFGAMTKRDKEPGFLGPKEVVLTFDDGPVPWITTSILDSLDTFCTKATFFSVGRMAIEYPQTVKDVMRRGHTLGTHTWSHPLNIARLPQERAVEQIEKGFAAVAMAAGQPIAPFFRFPGLSDSNVLLKHMQGRGIASFTVDVVSNDSYIGSPAAIAQRTLRLAAANNGGILLFHDIKAATAKALPTILAGLKAQGFTVVHLTSKAPMRPVADYDAELSAAMSKGLAARGGAKPLVPFFGAASPLMAPEKASPPVAQVAPTARERPIPVAAPAPFKAAPGQAAPRHQKRKRQNVATSDDGPGLLDFFAPAASASD